MTNKAEPEVVAWQDRIKNAREDYKVFSPDDVEQIVREAIAKKDAALKALDEAATRAIGCLKIHDDCGLTGALRNETRLSMAQLRDAIAQAKEAQQ